MRKRARALLWAAVCLMAGVTIFQWASAFGGSKEEAADPAEMLFEASLFQMELLASHAAEAARAASTGDLNGLKQAAYSAEFIHERLRRTRSGAIPELASVTELLEWIVRLQIGGERRLRPEENEKLSAAAPYFAELHEAYASLGRSGREGAAAAERVKKADEQIHKIVTGEPR